MRKMGRARVPKDLRHYIPQRLHIGKQSFLSAQARLCLGRFRIHGLNPANRVSWISKKGILPSEAPKLASREESGWKEMESSFLRRSLREEQGGGVGALEAEDCG